MNWDPRFLRLFSSALTAALLCAVHVAANSIPPPQAGDYGSTGPYSVSVETFPNPVYTAPAGTNPLDVSIYHPDAIIDPGRPTVFFAHGYSDNNGIAASYDALLRNLASQGYNVVFSPYEGNSAGINIPKRFDELTTGFEAAVTNYGLNTAAIGFAGHSYGGGFLPAVIQHEMMGVADQSGTPGHHWGATAAFAYSMAPGLAYGGLPVTQTISLPANLNLVEQAYNDDHTWADPRLAIDVFYNSTIPASQKDFLTVYGDSQESPAQVANHFLPTTPSSSSELQPWGVFRHIDALAAYTFTGDATAKALALGGGVPAETYMGRWSDGVPVVPMGATDYPSPSDYFDGSYAADWDSAANPRRNLQLVPVPTLPGDYNRDGVVDAADYTVWRDMFGRAVTAYVGADGNGDGVINVDDFELWESNFGAGAAGNGAGSARKQAAVPEPSAECLLFLGGVLIAWQVGGVAVPGRCLAA
jgi:hypothetical protein